MSNSLLNFGFSNMNTAFVKYQEEIFQKRKHALSQLVQMLQEYQLEYERF